MKLKYILFAVLFSFINDAFAQKVWTLKDCIEHAQQNNLQIKQSSLQVEQANINYLQSKGAFLPSLNGQATHSYNVGRTIDRFTNTFVSNQTVQSDNFNLSAQLNLFNGMQNVNNYKQNELNTMASKLELDKMLNDIALSIANLYLQVLFADELVSNATNQLQVSQQQVQRNTKLYEAGALPKETLLNVEAQLASEEVNKINAQNQLDLAYLSLQQVLDLDTIQDFKIQKPSLTPPNESTIAINAYDLYNSAQGLPQIKSAELRYKSSSYTLSSAKGGVSPSLSFFATMGTGYSGLQKNYTNSIVGYKSSGLVTADGSDVLQPDIVTTSSLIPFGQQLDQNLNQTFGFSLSVPIFNGFANKAQISRAKISQQSAQISLQNARLQLRKEIRQAHADALAAYRKYGANEKALAAMQETFKYTQQRFDIGLVNAVDYNTTKQRLALAESNLLQAKYEFVFRVKVLEFYQGKPIDL
jgi:outer membrane protein